MRRRLLALVSTVLFTASVQAEGTFPGEFLLEETYVGEASVQRGPKRVADFDESDTVAHLVFTPRIALGVLRLGAEYERFSFGFGAHAALPERLQSINGVMGLDTQLSDSILLRAEAEPGLYGDKLRSEDFNVPFVIGGTYIYSPDLQLVLGLGVDVERKYPVLPGGGIRWRFQPRWVLNAVLPAPRLEYELAKDITAYAGGNFKETSFRVGDSPDRRLARLDNAVLTYSEIRTGAGIDWKLTSWLSLNLEAGYQPYRTFDFYRANVRYHQEDGAPYGMISVHGAF